ncbi:MAG: hypothetical protein M1360_00180 [Candidatus Marsarchaeota archaeon]|jgi:hypothetical protein|nr:hypothetical protein [Candidatus Marsarchaeota archaeon]MCL5418346.1 hypothetical protein [Candidatus Marsarchaeota archaeon]
MIRMRHSAHPSKAQAALDFLIAYGIAILIIAVALYVIYRIGVFNPTIVPSYCNPAPSFMCNLASINTSGVLTFSFAQATGGEMDITGAACSTVANITGNGPMYGNIGVKGYGAAQYPSNELQGGLDVYSSNSVVVRLYCYGSGGIAKASLGSAFTGYVWLNYTYTGLPQNMHNIEEVATISTKYT